MPLQPHLVLSILPVFAGFVALEWLILRRSSPTPYSLRASLATIGVGIGHRLSHVLRLGGLGALSAWLWSHRIATIPSDTLWGLVLLFLAVEFAYYWYHRCTHTVRWLWATHAVHHSPEELNVLAAFRLGWTSMLSGDFLFFLPLALLGFNPIAVSAALAFNLLYQSWVHTETIPKLGVLEHILNTPSNHRVHHASNEIYLDRNYGGVLIIFDRLFGTYVEERADVPCRYGLVRPIVSTNPFRIVFHEWIAMARDVITSHSLGEALAHMFGRPGWSPPTSVQHE